MCPSAECAADAGEEGAGHAAARIPVGRDDMGVEEVIGCRNLGFGQVSPILHFALVGHSAFHRAALHAASAVDEAEAALLLDEHLDDRFGAAEIMLTLPLIIRFDDGDRSRALWSSRDLALGALLRR